jgi:trehalose-phosphatase
MTARSTQPGGPTAAVFDLDGVVTFTAHVHYSAWKALFDPYLRARTTRYAEPFRPFEPPDYQAFVDGRPRYEGVRTFLASRGIELPYGSPIDAPGHETVCGLGNRKNQLFDALLQEQGVEVDPHTLRLIEDLRGAGIRVGMASSSRNAAAVLARAGLSALFDASVDGTTSERDGLQGKPAPDIFLQCLALLGGNPRTSIVIEDAAAGVQAGRTGGFGLVVGVDRGGNWLRLRQHGADWIVRDLAELSANRILEYLAAREHVRPNALTAWPELSRMLAGRPLALFLDYDGTLTPIVDRPDLAVLSDDMREALRHVARVWPTTIVSGRGRNDVEALVGVDTLTYAGSHGFDVAGAAGSNLRLEVDPEIVPLMTRIAAALQARTAHIPNVLIENKRFSVAVHYRLTPDQHVADVERMIDEMLVDHPQLKKTFGKKVFELRPARQWDKGKAVLWLMEHMHASGSDVVPVFIGDDTTDEDAFLALAHTGVGVVVLEMPRATAARYSLQNVDEVSMLLEQLAGMASPQAAFVSGHSTAHTRAQEKEQ